MVNNVAGGYIDDNRRKQQISTNEVSFDFKGSFTPIAHDEFFAVVLFSPWGDFSNKISLIYVLIAVQYVFPKEYSAP